MLEVAPLALDMTSFRLTGAYGVPCFLAPDQASLLATLMRKPGVAISWDGLAQAVYGRKRPPNARLAVASRIYRLRTDLDAIGGRGMIRTVHDEGWRLAKPDASVDGLHQRWLTDEQVRMFDLLFPQTVRGDHHA
jgi:DNA-binding response OmpR family regulator